MRIIALYKEYNMVIKPLIAELEARTEQFPLHLFNEIRALHDHIARCYSERGFLLIKLIQRYIRQSVRRRMLI